MGDEALHRRVQWRCRRGTKELDALYGWWLQNCWDEADTATRVAFAELLDMQDPDLWDWTVGTHAPPRADWEAIIHAIRAQHKL